MTGLCCVMFGRLVLAAFIIPPWQNPDEPSHFAVIRVLAQGPIDRSKGRDPSLEGEILTSMAKYGWWDAYSEPVPDPFPTTFDEVPPAHLSFPQFGQPALYYLAAAQFCRVIGARRLLDQYFALRTASLLMTCATFAIIILAAREWFDETVALCTGALVALVPQFIHIGIAVTPDPLVFLAAAVVWWQAARLMAGKAFVVPVAIMLAAAIVALLAKRGGAPLMAQAGGFVILGSLVRAAAGWRAVAGTIALLALAVPAAWAAIVFAGRSGELSKLYDLWEFTVLYPQDRPLAPDYFFTFTWRLFASAYLAAGWLRFWPPVAVTVLAAAAATFGVVRGFGLAVLEQDGRIRLGLWCALLMVIVQLAAIYGTRNYLPDSGAQGRFLFAVIGPFAAICAIGFGRWQSARMRTVVCGGLVGLMAVLDAVSWATAVIPPYGR